MRPCTRAFCATSGSTCRRAVTRSSTPSTPSWCRSTAATNCRQYLRERGIKTAIHYPIPIHLQPAARELGPQEGRFPGDRASGGAHPDAAGEPVHEPGRRRDGGRRGSGAFLTGPRRLCSFAPGSKGYLVKRPFLRERLSEIAQVLRPPLKTRRLLFEKGSQARTTLPAAPIPLDLLNHTDALVALEVRYGCFGLVESPAVRTERDHPQQHDGLRGNSRRRRSGGPLVDQPPAPRSVRRAASIWSSSTTCRSRPK